MSGGRSGETRGSFAAAGPAGTTAQRSKIVTTSPFSGTLKRPSSPQRSS
jgi:hypothetical protein